MLVLTRKVGESIVIDTHAGEVEVEVTSVLGEKVRLGITGPREVNVLRKEIRLEPGYVHLPALLSTAFGISRSEARRLITQGGVRLNEDRVVVTDIATEHCTGELRVGTRRSVEVANGCLVPVSEAA